MENEFNNRSSTTILINEFKNSIYGFKIAFKNEKRIRQEIYLAIALIPLGLLIGETFNQKFLLISSVLITLIIEPLKPLIQSVVDSINFENIYLARHLKNVGNIAVFIAIINLFLTWLLILFL
tara:strand:- start:274 stop:642 length:369 start_codon:yes stop_codon:yes gene_type:complete